MGHYVGEMKKKNGKRSKEKKYANADFRLVIDTFACFCSTRFNGSELARPTFDSPTFSLLATPVSLFSLVSLEFFFSLPLSLRVFELTELFFSQVKRQLDWE